MCEKYRTLSSGNSRNGTSRKKLKGDFGEAEIEVPRDRNGSFKPQIVAQAPARFTGFDDKILSMYARGMTTREIQGHLEEIYGVEVSPIADLGGDRCGDRGGEGVAEPAAGAVYPIVLPGCADGEDAARRAGGEPGRVRGHRHGSGGPQGSAGAVDHAPTRAPSSGCRC